VVVAPRLVAAARELLARIRDRGRCARLSDEPGARPPEPAADAPGIEGDFRPTAFLFLRALGLVYLVVFASLAGQARLLIGGDGLLPVHDFLAAHRAEGVARFWRVPTLFWFWDSDAAIRLGTILGLALAIGLLAGWRSKSCLVGLWLLFVSYVAAGRDFFWFQWDSLLLESTALALLLPAVPARQPHPLVIFLFRWLVFRLLFESGLAKLQQGQQSWFPLIAMAAYYETAPLPSIGGWYAHQLPLWGHRWASALTLLGELVGPLLIWGHRRARSIGFALIVGFQVLIQATANYGYFNLLSAALALFLLDGRHLRRLPAWLRGGRLAPNGDGASIGPTARPRPLVAAAAAAIFLLTLLELMILVGGRGVAESRSLMAVHELTQAFRVANKYHLFAHIDPRRIEAEIEWSADGQQWHPYYMHYKPGPPARRPPIVAPHQPRVDFQLWFFTLGRDGGGHTYFNTLVARLCRGSDTVRPLFLPDSLPDRPPLVIRIAYYRYRMTDPSILATEGRYWSRELLGYHPKAHFCDAPTDPAF